MKVKINNNGEMLDATIEMVDGVMVVSPKEVKFEPKDGDVVTYMNGDKATIYVFAGGYKYNTSFYVAYSGLHNKVFKTLNGHLNMNRDDIRPATEEEKKMLFDKLVEEGYEFDFNKKELVKLKWKPSMYDPYYSPFYDTFKFIPMGTNWNGRNKDNIRYNKGLCFKVEKECQEFCNRLNDAIKSVKP